MRTSLRCAVVVIAAIAVVAVGSVRAIERRPLPAFTLTDLNGQPVASETLPTAGKWLLIYVQPKCDSCDALLRTIDVRDQPGLPSRMAIVVGRADAAAAAAQAARFPDLSAAHWYAGRDRSASEALKVVSAPMVFGVRDDRLEWSVAGIVPDLDGVKSALITWAGHR